MAVRAVRAVAAFAAAAAVFLLVRDRRLRREWARERVTSRLMDGCLHADLDAFRGRLEAALGQRAGVSAAGSVDVSEESGGGSA